MLLLAERMRNSGKYTMADVLAFRLRERPARTAAAIGTLFVVGFYLIAQMIAAGSLIEALAGLSFPVAVLITGAAMLLYVLLGGMLATTWVQIIKAVLLMGAVLTLALFVLGKFGWDPIQIFNTAQAKADNPAKYLGAGRVLLRGAAGRHLDRHRLRARHRRPAPHPHALLHRAHRQGGARLGAAGPSRSSASSTASSRSSASARGPCSARAARSSRATAATWPRPTWPSRWAAARARRAATSSSP